MLDIDFIRNNQEVIKEAVEKRGADVDIDRLLEVDDSRRERIQEVDTLREKQNAGSDTIAQIDDEKKRQERINEMKELKKEIADKEDALEEVMKEWKELMLAVPNIPDVSVPDGEDETDNVEETKSGTVPSFDFEPKDHRELMKNLGMVDFKRGRKVHGFRGYFLKGAGAQLQWALWNHAREFYMEFGFTPFVPPVVVNKEYFIGTGHLPSEADDLYTTQDDDYLAGTAEVPMMAYHAEETLSKKELPKRYLAYSPCFRREAGSHGKDTKGLIRVHEFYKIEQLILCEAHHERSVELHEEINEHFESFLGTLELPYRRVNMCTGDLKGGQVKCYDTEAWMPAQDTYRELASASYYHDFQTRRFNIQYEDTNTKHYAHSLNGTGVATPRIIAAIVENFQNKDGSVTVPEPLQQYIQREKITPLNE
jgi:seryl-tRNA synthetase